MAIKKTTTKKTSSKSSPSLSFSELQNAAATQDQSRDAIAARAVEATNRLAASGGSSTKSKTKVVKPAKTVAPIGAAGATPKSLGLSYTEDPYEADIDKRTKALLSSYGSELPDEKKVRRGVLDQFQTEIDALSRASAQETARITNQYGTIEKGRLGSDAAIQARRGLAGSDFGAARTENISSEVRGNRDEAIGRAQSAFDQKRESLMTQARNLASQEYQNKLLAYQTGAAATVQYLRNKQTTAAANAGKLAKQAYLSGIDLTDPENALELKTLAQQVGVTPETFVQIYQDYQQQAAAAERAAYLEDRKYQLDVDKENNLNIREGNKLAFDKNKFDLEYKLNSRKVEAEIEKISNDIANGGGAGLLTPEQAEKYGVPYGTTKAGMIGVIPMSVEQLEKDKQALTGTSSLLDMVRALQTHPGSKGAVGFDRTATAFPGPQKDYVKLFDQFQANMQLENLYKLKGSGSITDREQETLSKAATSLARNSSPEAFFTELKKIEKELITRQNKIRTKLSAVEESKRKVEAANAFEALDGGSEGTNPKVQNLTTSINTQKLASFVGPKYPQGTKLGNKEGQCITFLHKIADFPPIGDGKNEKIASLNKLIGQGKGLPKEALPNNARVGMILISNDNKTYGHGSMINAISKDGRYARLTESNRLGAGTVTHTRVVALDDPSIYGAIIPNKFKIA